ncbi:MAG: Fe(2+)-trafficking protein [Phycisphaerae bacterium]|mgnify:CR=1 FL=1|nr:Fe(2+)-trafficking protein [Phycisphaerae bacterium]
MDIQQRIAQFETMVRPEADPHNDMAWFSLGGAYAQAGRHADAARAYTRCFEINPAMSKAYQLAGKALIDSGDTAGAIVTLTRGFHSAAGRGDFLPRKAMGELLASLGAPVPQLEEETKTPAAVSDGFVCGRTGRPGTKMVRPPFRGPVGEWIAANISQETWMDWIKQGTKVINELRLDLSREEDSATYDRHMREYLGIDESVAA